MNRKKSVTKRKPPRRATNGGDKHNTSVFGGALLQSETDTLYGVVNDEEEYVLYLTRFLVN
jgi:hypothetical protein